MKIPPIPKEFFSGIANTEETNTLLYPDYMIRDSIADKHTDKIWFSSPNVIRSQFISGLNKVKEREISGARMEKTCSICGSPMDPVFSGTILKKYVVQYFHCSCCGYVCTEHPYWLEESYQNAINVTDTGILSRNIDASKISSCIIFLFLKKDQKGLDYGGGYGILTRLMRDIGFDFYWCDPHAKNLFAQGFEYPKSCTSVEVITAFENFEHFTNPLDDLEKIFSLSHNVIFSTEMLPDPLPKPDDWWYYGLEHGQHVSFYSKKTLQSIAKKFGVQVYSYNDVHFFTDKKINKTFWKFVCKFGVRVIFPLLQINMKSKSVEDMHFLRDTGEI